MSVAFVPSNEHLARDVGMFSAVLRRDIIDAFVRDSILDRSGFEWESQLRFYWMREPDSLVVQQCTGNNCVPDVVNDMLKWYAS